MLDVLRRSFIYIVAFVFPIAGVLLTVVRFGEGDRDQARSLAGATLLGICAYALAFRLYG